MSDLKCKTFHPLYMPLVSSGLLKPDWNEGRVFSFLFSGSAKAINYIYSNFFLRYTLSNITPILMNINSRIKFTDRCSLIVFPSTAIPERLPIKNICEISFHIFLYCFIVSTIITIKIPTMKSTVLSFTETPGQTRSSSDFSPVIRPSLPSPAPVTLPAPSQAASTCR